MLNKEYPGKVKVFFAFIYSSRDAFGMAVEDITSIYGNTDISSKEIKFDFTGYYKDEMGGRLMRRFVSLEKLLGAEELVNIKNFCIEIEKKYSIEGKRRVNIDPGYINCSKVVLATTKDFSHRIYIGDGIFAEVTLLFRDKTWRDLPWTFPDYRTKEYKQYFMSLKEVYRKQLKNV